MALVGKEHSPSARSASVSPIPEGYAHSPKLTDGSDPTQTKCCCNGRTMCATVTATNTSTTQPLMTETETSPLTQK